MEAIDAYTYDPYIGATGMTNTKWVLEGDYTKVVADAQRELAKEGWTVSQTAELPEGTLIEIAFDQRDKGGWIRVFRSKHGGDRIVVNVRMRATIGDRLLDAFFHDAPEDPVDGRWILREGY